MRFSLATVYVNDMDESIAFYNGILGIDVLGRHPIANGGELAMLGIADQPKIELLYSPGGKSHSYDGFSIGFDVESLEKATAMLEKAGYPVKRGPISPSPGVSFSFFSDPNGIEIELVEIK